MPCACVPKHARGLPFDASRTQAALHQQQSSARLQLSAVFSLRASTVRSEICSNHDMALFEITNSLDYCSFYET